MECPTCGRSCWVDTDLKPICTCRETFAIRVTFADIRDFTHNAMCFLSGRDMGSDETTIKAVNALAPAKQSHGKIKASIAGAGAVVYFENNHDFLALASVIIGAVYTRVPDAIRRLNNMLPEINCKGIITADHLEENMNTLPFTHEDLPLRNKAAAELLDMGLPLTEANLQTAIKAIKETEDVLGSLDVDTKEDPAADETILILSWGPTT